MFEIMEDYDWKMDALMEDALKDGDKYKYTEGGRKWIATVMKKSNNCWVHMFIEFRVGMCSTVKFGDEKKSYPDKESAERELKMKVFGDAL